MSRLRNALTTTAILAGSSVALLTGGIAKAEPAPAPPPQIPGLNMIQSIPAMAPQLLQAATQVLSGMPAAAPAAPATPPPLASASVNLPAQPAALPGTPAAPATAGIPGITPAVTPAAAPANGALPAGELSLPSVPGLPVPLPQRLSFPGDLGSLLPGATAGPAITQPGLAPAASATSPLPGIGALFPTYALP